MHLTLVDVDDRRERWAAITGLAPDDTEVADSSEFVCSAAEAAEILGLDIDQVQQLVTDGTLYGERLDSGEWVIARSSVDGLRGDAPAH